MSVSRLVTDGCAPGSLGAHPKGRGARVVQGRPGGGGSESGVKWAGVSLLRVGGGRGQGKHPNPTGQVHIRREYLLGKSELSWKSEFSPPAEH